MISITYSHKAFRDGKETDSSSSKAPPFSDMKAAKSWATTKWKFLNWPSNKMIRKGSVEKDGKMVNLLEWTAEKDDGIYIKKFEMLIVEVV